MPSQYVDLKVLKYLINHLPYYVFWKDLNCVYLGCNELFAKNAGLASAEEIIGKTDYDLPWTKEEADWYLTCDRQAMDNDQAELDIDETQLTSEGEKTVIRTSKIPLHGEDGKVVGILGFFTDITEIEEKRAQVDIQEKILNNVANCVLISAPDGTIRWANPAVCELTGYAKEKLIGSNTSILKSEKHDKQFYHNIQKQVMSGKIWHGEINNRKKDGTVYVEDVTFTPIQDEQGTIEYLITVGMDVSAKKDLERKLSQARKLESVGQLAAGIAHEINSPAQFVGSNIDFLKDANKDVFKLIGSYQELLNKARRDSLSNSDISEVEKLQDELDLEYFKDEIPSAIEQSQEGINRITKIVRAMKEFSHPASKEKTETDLNKLVETTLTVASNEWKYVANIKLNLTPNLPMVECFADEMGQVFLNIIVNAAHAIADKESSKEDELITISSLYNDSWVEIRITDSGLGIPESVQNHIFDPFFTTKEVGKGTGQGLSISYNIVTVKHDGEITFETIKQEGTTFIIRLPR